MDYTRLFGFPAGAVGEAAARYADAARRILLIAGPNGAGKTTFARQFLPREGRCMHFVNADQIAAGLAPFDPSSAAIRAGRIMLAEVHAHVQAGTSFAVETTLAGHRYLAEVPRWQAAGYAVKLIYLRLASVDLALARVASRVAEGGHAIPEDAIRRRYAAGWRQFNEISPMVDAWVLFDSSAAVPVLVADEEKA